LLGATWLGGCMAPVVLMGDFNMLPGARPYRAFTRQLRDGHSLLRRAHATFPARRPLVRIDHIFISTGIDVHDMEIRHHAAARVASDHLPLALDIKITSF
jgi:endonuclease/exonuclease/phosphatase family metal-dependent hydrolase